jgi:sugar/nucleoside kinase (ribokinase family)
MVSRYDLVLVSDFGHGFITEKIFNTIEKNAKILAINTQTNAANAGYNLITKYHNPNYVCLDEAEVRLAAQKKHSDIEEITRGIRESINAHYLIVTMGKSGSLGVNHEGKINKTPIFSTRVVDTIGAGDAFFAFTAPCFARGLPLDLVSFLGNAVGALAVQIVCNKRAVEKDELLEFINTLVK